MGVQLTELMVKHETAIQELSGKRLAVDSSVWLYQFLSSIRQRDGSPLSDSRGRVTSHLLGLFSRVPRLMEAGIKLIFVFDGEPPRLKLMEKERRRVLKEEAEEHLKEAEKKGDAGEMKKYASRTSRLTGQIAEEAKELVRAMGLPVVDAPSEGEAQAAFIVKNGDADMVSSQDADSLLFGAPLLVRNISIYGRRKYTNHLSSVVVHPEMISLDETLSSLGISHDQLIFLSILVGTDYNPGGIKGIGPKKALSLVKQYANPEELFRAVGWGSFFSYSWRDVYDTIINIPLRRDYSLGFRGPDTEALMKLLVEEHEFSRERVERTIKRIQRVSSVSQSSLSSFLGGR